MGISTSTATVKIASGTALSGAVYLGDKVLTALVMPAAWDAADITFQTSYDGGVTWVDLIDSSKAEIKITAPAAAKPMQLDPSDFIACQYLKVRSGVTALAVNQSGDRTLILFSRKFYPIH